MSGHAAGHCGGPSYCRVCRDTFVADVGRALDRIADDRAQDKLDTLLGVQRSVGVEEDDEHEDEQGDTDA